MVKKLRDLGFSRERSFEQIQQPDVRLFCVALIEQVPVSSLHYHSEEMLPCPTSLNEVNDWVLLSTSTVAILQELEQSLLFQGEVGE